MYEKQGTALISGLETLTQRMSSRALVTTCAYFLDFITNQGNNVSEKPEMAYRWPFVERPLFGLVSLDSVVVGGGPRTGVLQAYRWVKGQQFV